MERGLSTIYGGQAVKAEPMAVVGITFAGRDLIVTPKLAEHLGKQLIEAAAECDKGVAAAPSLDSRVMRSTDRAS